jgi:hypothetical protein
LSIRRKYGGKVQLRITVFSKSGGKMDFPVLGPSFVSVLNGSEFLRDFLQESVEEDNRFTLTVVAENWLVIRFEK